jgi:hypothetical protein
MQSLLFKRSLDIPCFSHTINNAGEAAETPKLLQFTQWFPTLFSKSPANKLFWKTMTGLPQLPTVSETRWWSRFELYDKVMTLWPDICSLVEKEEFAESSPETRKRLSKLIADEGNVIRLELAALIDTGKMFYQATYALEADGELMTVVFDIIEPIRLFIEDPLTPNVDVVLDSISLNPEYRRQLLEYASSCIAPMFSYFKLGITDAEAPLRPFLNICKASRIFDPDKYVAMSAAARLEIEPLQALFPTEMLAAMKEQAASYLHHSSEYTVASAGGVLKWWANFGHNIPAWQDAALRLFSLAPSSAAVERVFSQLNSMFTDSQERAKSDLIEAALMLRCNQHISSE